MPESFLKPDQDALPTAPDAVPRSLAARIFFSPYLQIFVSVLLNAAAQLLLKKGSDESVEATTSFALGFSGLHSAWVWGGIACMIASLVSWLYSLRFVQLIIAFNLAGMLHVMVPLFAWICLGERIGGLRWLGIGLVFAGVLVVAKPVIKIEEL